eukprot:SAG11_NODE_570_length_8454_cov_19.886655_4_plen_88_part_00
MYLRISRQFWNHLQEQQIEKYSEESVKQNGADMRSQNPLILATIKDPFGDQQGNYPLEGLSPKLEIKLAICHSSLARATNSTFKHSR